ncbi:HWE histidine kinase domain-containing protein [Henriciella litoralis]|uniref:HWE histidine kinase domain-containing protein n=1 Tax=Henriciella litoralis TaxID=568102 RepID=UPI000A014350|nr:HWE histidine kinase domain-containing protein [Henriciella litoralis]
MPHRIESLRKNLDRLETDFDTLASSIPQLAWMADAEGNIFWYNQRWYDFTGTELDDVEGWKWQSVHHPDHVDRVVAKVKQSFAAQLPWEDLFPLRSADGVYRWFLTRARPVRDDNGKVVRWFGTNTDVTEQKNIEERQVLLMREIDHRAKNALTVAQAIVNLSHADTIEDFRAAVSERLGALSRAYGLLADARWESADLKKLVHDEVVRVAGRDNPHVEIKGKSVELRPEQAQTIGLILHELTVNAARFGALSQENGRLEIDWRENESRITLNWRESGGPVTQAPDRTGFGTGVIDRLAEDFDGRLLREWRPDGIAVTLSINSGEINDTPASRTRVPIAASANRKPRILIVEDEPMTALDLEMRLSDANYDVMGPAGSLLGAKNELEHGLPDIALLDTNLRGEKSYGLAIKLRSEGVPVIFCTGYEELEDLPESLLDCPVISKPFRDEVLMSTLESALVREKV